MKKRRKRKKNKIIIIIIFIAAILLVAVNIILYQLMQDKLKSTEKMEIQQQALKNEINDLTQKNEEMKEQIQTEETDELITSQAEEEKKLRKIDELIKNTASSGAINSEDWQIYVCRLSDGADASFGEGNAQSASLIKLYIMGAVYADYEQLTSVNEKEHVDSLLYSMITVSDNDSANELTTLLGNGDAVEGRKAVTDYCSKNGYQNTSMGRMLLESKENGDNYTSAVDCGNFLKQIYNKKIDYSNEMLNLLKNQERREKIPAGIPNEIRVGNKTGELEDVENDAAIVWAGETPYVICIMSEQLKDTDSARKTIVQLSSEIYKNIEE